MSEKGSNHGSTTNLSDGSGSAVRLKKNLGLHNGVAVIVGIMIGSGIFLSPKGVLQEVNSVGGHITIWALCGVVSLVGAMCYAELGTMICKSGADYAYIFEAFGPLPAFLYLWVAIIVVVPTGNAVVALTFSHYVLHAAYPSCDPPHSAVALLAALAILLLTFINCWNVNYAAKVQNFFTVAKIVALIIIIIIGVIQICRGRVENFENAFADTNKNPGSIALAFYSGLFSYAGWNYLNFITEELKDPYKNLPRAIWISMPLVTIIYTFANVAYLTVLSPQELLESNAVAVTFADRMLGVMSWVMPLFVAASTFGGLNGAILTSSRLYFVGARYGHLPDFFALINVKLFTPLPALVFGCLMSVVMLCTSDVYVLINYVTFVESLFIGMSIAGMLYMRWKFPNMHRPIKVNLILPIFFMIIMTFLIICPLFTNAWECVIGLIMVVSGIPVYIIGVLWKKKPKAILNLIRSCTLLTQKVMNGINEEPKED